MWQLYCFQYLGIESLKAMLQEVIGEWYLSSYTLALGVCSLHEEYTPESFLIVPYLAFIAEEIGEKIVELTTGENGTVTCCQSYPMRTAG